MARESVKACGFSEVASFAFCVACVSHIPCSPGDSHALQFPRFLPRLSLMTCAALALALPGAARAEDGGSADIIVVGQVAPL